MSVPEKGRKNKGFYRAHRALGTRGDLYGAEGAIDVVQFEQGRRVSPAGLLLPPDLVAGFLQLVAGFVSGFLGLVGHLISGLFGFFRTFVDVLLDVVSVHKITSCAGRLWCPLRAS